MTDVPAAARCRQCGYPLRQLSQPRCPECGRPFDPADPGTMDLGRRPGPVARALLRPTGRPLVGVAVVGAALVATATRWPVGAARLATTDLLYYFAGGRFDRTRLLSYTDWAYVGGLLVLGVALGVWLIRAATRPVVQRRYLRPPPPPDLRRRAVLATVAAVVAVVAGGGVLVGWPYRVARLWARRALAVLRSPTYIGPANAPLSLSDEQEVAVLRTGLAQLPGLDERLACLGLLNGLRATSALSAVWDQLSRERDPVMRVALVHLIGLHRDYAALGRLLSLWDDADPDVRAAAIDAVGLLHAQAYPIPNPSDRWPRTASLATDPPVSLGSIPVDDGENDPADRNARRSPFAFVPRSVDDRLDPLRPRFVDRMLRGATNVERQAAARALLPWQPAGYRLRAAEWGVWVADQTGHLTLVRSLLDEIPPFVHRTGDTLASLGDRVGAIMDVTKPILHVTVDRPMVLDVQVLIAGGRPWFAFPQPDDFTLSTRILLGGQLPNRPGAMAVSPVQQFDRPNAPPLDRPREGYPWIDPPHRTVGPSGGMFTSSNQARSLGLRWQSVIVSPERQPWMVPPAMPADARFAWWERLRHVDPCAWVSSRGEAERFLYYDGPTTAAAPVAVTRDGDHLRFVGASTPLRDELPGSNEQSFPPLVTPVKGDRRGLFVDVAAGAVRGWVLDTVDDVDLSGQPSLVGEVAVAAELHGMLVAAGLTDGEAAGLVDCWRPQLFHTDGSRFLLLMTAGDYDALCPIRIDPPPTELVRVGLVLTEFSDGPASRPA